jgi:hypothetical protein
MGVFPAVIRHKRSMMEWVEPALHQKTTTNISRMMGKANFEKVSREVAEIRSIIFPNP